MFKVLIADKLNEVAVEMLEKEGFEVKKPGMYLKKN